MRIHAIDIVQPPGIGIPPRIAAHATTVAAERRTNSAMTIPNVRVTTTSVAIVMADPRLRSLRALFITPLRHDVEVVVRSIHHVDTARVARIRVEDVPALILVENACTFALGEAGTLVL